MSAAYLARALAEARIIELRAKTPAGWCSGTFDRYAPMHEAILACAAAKQTVFMTLNRPGPHIVATNAMGTRALRDDDIEAIVRLPFDLDPIRPTGTASTQAELAAAMQVRAELVKLLSAAGWPMPALGMSGNGAHAIYRVLVRNTDAWRAGVATIFYALRERLAEDCQEAGVNFDVTVRNPARIWRIYGTRNLKGEPTAARPHRKAIITMPASGWQVVSRSLLQRTIAAWTPVVQERTAPRRSAFTGKVVSSGGDYRTLDVAGWFKAHGAYLRPLQGGKHAVRCPWVAEHSNAPDALDSSTVVWEADGGWPTFHCSHAHCAGRRIEDVMALWGDADAHCTRQYEGRNHG